MRALFIGGFGRSGSTLVERILGELPGVRALGEVALLWHHITQHDVRCGCGVPFPECEFWIAVGQEAFGGWRRCDTARVLALQQQVGRNRHIPRLLAAPRTRHRLALVREYAEFYTRVYAAAAAVDGAGTVVDSSKNPGLAFCLSQLDGLDLRAVHLVRDPRGVAYSATKHVRRPEAAGEALLPRQPPAMSAVLWNAQNLAMGLLARQGVPLYRLRYEDLVADPRGETSALAEFAGQRPTEAALSYLDDGHAVLPARHSAAGNPMRFTTGRVALHRDDAWRAGLPARHRRLVAATCGPLLAAYGYPLSNRSVPDGPR